MKHLHLFFQKLLDGVVFDEVLSSQLDAAIVGACHQMQGHQKAEQDEEFFQGRTLWAFSSRKNAIFEGCLTRIFTLLDRNCKKNFSLAKNPQENSLQFLMDLIDSPYPFPRIPRDQKLAWGEKVTCSFCQSKFPVFIRFRISHSSLITFTGPSKPDGTKGESAL